MGRGIARTCHFLIIVRASRGLTSTSPDQRTPTLRLQCARSTGRHSDSATGWLYGKRNEAGSSFPPRSSGGDGGESNSATGFFRWPGCCLDWLLRLWTCECWTCFSSIELHQGAGASALGKAKQKQLPSPGTPELSAQIRPPIASSNCLLM